MEGDKKVKPNSLPKFSDVTKFWSFWDSFKSTADENRSAKGLLLIWIFLVEQIADDSPNFPALQYILYDSIIYLIYLIGYSFMCCLNSITIII